MKKLKFARYDYAAFSLFAAYAAISLAVPTVLVQMAEGLDFALADGGMAEAGRIHLWRSIAMCFTLAGSGFMAAKFGNRKTLAFAAIIMGIGILFCASAPAYIFVLPAILLAGLGEGIIEGLATPFVQDMHDEDQGRYVNFTHGFWSLGIIIGVLLLGALIVIGVSWRIVLALTALFSLIPILLLLLPSKRPYVEKGIGTSSSEVFSHVKKAVKSGRFWLYFLAMIFAGGGEYCISFWCSSFIQLEFKASAFAGAFGTAAFSLGMFLGRTGFGAYVPKHRLKHLVVITGVGSALVSLLIPLFTIHLSLFPTWSLQPIIFLLLFISGIGVAPFWPSIQSLSVDKMPEYDSTTLFILLSLAGVPGCGLFCWLIGEAGDIFGITNSFFIVPIAFILMSVFVLLAARRRSDAATLRVAKLKVES